MGDARMDAGVPGRRAMRFFPPIPFVPSWLRDSWCRSEGHPLFPRVCGNTKPRRHEESMGDARMDAGVPGYRAMRVCSHPYPSCLRGFVIHGADQKAIRHLPRVCSSTKPRRHEASMGDARTACPVAPGCPALWGCLLLRRLRGKPGTSASADGPSRSRRSTNTCVKSSTNSTRDVSATSHQNDRRLPPRDRGGPHQGRGAGARRGSGRHLPGRA